MEDQRFLPKIIRGLKRDTHIGVGNLLRRGASLASQTVAAKLFLRDCTSVGAGARVLGRVRIENQGSIHIGDGLMLNGSFLPVELLSGHDGRIDIRDGVWINFGSLISAKRSVTIGARAHMGPHCILSDTDLPEMSANGAGEAKSIEIGEDVWLAGRVTVLPGVTIGAGTVVTAGSIVQNDLPPGVIAGGIPARVLRRIAGANGTDVSAAKSANGAHAGASEPEPLVTSAPAPRFTGTLVSDFTIDELADELSGPVEPVLAANVAPFGQVTQVLLGAPALDASDYVVVWTRAEGAVPSFSRILAFDDVSDDELFAEVDAFTKLIARAASGYRFVFVPTWVLPSWVRGLGMLDARQGGAQRALLAMNLRLMNNLGGVSNVFVLDAERWFRLVGLPVSSHRAWYLGKMAVPRSVMAEAAADIKAAMLGLTGSARKLVIVDLDDTLWGGIVGDVGWEALRLGGHDAEGEAFVDFQRALKSLKRRGIVLGIVSKNEESVALDAIRSHPEMVLREDDFVGWKINWTDKAKNILDLVRELNLGLQSVVFIDDNPVERARVREALPEVLVPDWPVDKLLYPSTLTRLRCFDSPALSREDLERTRLYAEERKREQLQEQVGSVEDWLKSLELRVRAEPLKPANLARSAQLLNKTNQLNLSTRRLTEGELTEWARGPGRGLWAVSVSDRFGDAGLTGIVSIERDGADARIVDYLLSCRVMGRKVEETMVHMAVVAARAAEARTLSAHFVPTAKNKPCFSFWKTSGFENQDDRVFTWDLSRPFPLPDPITLEWER